MTYKEAITISFSGKNYELSQTPRIASLKAFLILQTHLANRNSISRDYAQMLTDTQVRALTPGMMLSGAPRDAAQGVTTLVTAHCKTNFEH